MRVLFFPSDRGGGFGHISRCLVLAQETVRRGHVCSFVISDTKYQRIVGSDFPALKVKPHVPWSAWLFGTICRMARTRTESVPLYCGISGLDYQLVRDGLVTEQAVECTLERYRHVVQTFKPDILVGDTNLLLWILAREVSLPVAQIVRYASHPKTAKMIWWESEPVGMIPPNSADLFNQILSKMGLKPINRAEDLLEGDLYLIPSIHEIEPVPLDEKTFHVGELTLSESEGEAPIWFEAMNNGQPLVYVTIGGGAGNVGNKLFFSTIIKAFSNKNIQVVVSTSSKFNPQDFTNLPPNIHFFEWVPGKFLISKANLVVFHGGYGTMMESIACGKPTVTIPFHSEQEGNGRRLEQAGCGRVVKLSRENYKQIEGKWKYGKYSYLVQNRYDLRPEELFENVDKILFKAEYLHNAQRLQSKLKEYHGAVKTLDLLEKHLR